MCKDTGEFEKVERRGWKKVNSWTPQSFFWCVKSLLLCGFSIAFCLSWCLLHNSTQDALQARRERQRESQRAGWKGMYGGWALKSKLKQNKHWESVITEWRCFVMFACSCASIWTKWKKTSFVVKLDPLCVTATKVTLQHTLSSRPKVLESHTVTSERALAPISSTAFVWLSRAKVKEREMVDSEKSMGWGWEAD